MKKKIFATMIILSLLVLGCATTPTTKERNCYNACLHSHICSEVQWTHKQEIESRECRMECWNICFPDIINESQNISGVSEDRDK